MEEKTDLRAVIYHGAARKNLDEAALLAGAYTPSPFRLNVSAFCGIGGACRGCLGDV